MVATPWRRSSLILSLAVLAAILLAAPRAASAQGDEAFPAHDRTYVCAIASGTT